MDELRESLLSSMARTSGLYVWLKVRTNLIKSLKPGSGYVPVGELYRAVLFHVSLPPVELGNGTFQIPHSFSPRNADIELLLKRGFVKLYFGLTQLPPLLGKYVGDACFTHGRGKFGFYMNFTAPPTMLRVLKVEGLCISERLCLYNVTFEPRKGYLLLQFVFDERTGRKLYARFPMNIGVFVDASGELELVNDDAFSRLGRVTTPLPTNAVDVWLEPEHEYVATVISPEIFTLTFRFEGRSS